MIARLQPNRVRRTYLGGGRIDAFCGTTFTSGRDDGEAQPLPEDWMASTVTAFNGKLEIEGEGLGRLTDGRLVRDAVGELPILVKLLDSDERLVIQAHPTVPFARARLDSPVGKTECWYFLPGTASDACVYLGFKPGVTREAWREAFAAQTGMLDMLRRVPVAPGDFVFVGGGVPHAIGGGCFMIELQEPSDLMVVAERLTPSGREIPERKIHCGLGLDDMFDVYSYEGMSYGELCARYVRRGVSGRILGSDLTDKFEMWLLKGGDSLAPSRQRGVAVVTGGSGSLNGVAVAKGDRLVFSDEKTLSLSGSAEVVSCF